MERTEEDKVFKSPITVILAGKEYNIPLLVIKDAREWRKRAASLFGRLPAYAKTTTDDATGFDHAITAMLVDMPDQTTDLFFAYAKTLNREEIESTATEVELAKAIEQVMAVAFPLLGSLAGALKR